LQGRADDATAAAGDRCRATAFAGLFKDDAFSAGARDLDGRRDAGAAAANDRNIGPND
jgi:hypothetical protein